MTARLSSAQYTILKSMAPRDGAGPGSPLAFEKAIQFNQVIFYSLVRRGFIVLNLTQETFSLSPEGLEAFNRYTRTDIKDFYVANNTPARHERVGFHLAGDKKLPRKKSPKSTVRATAA